MSTELALIERPHLQVVITQEQLDLAKNTVAKDATDAEFALFVYDCKRRGVHPLDRLIHFTKRAGKYTPVTSIDMFRSRAAASGQHMGTDDAEFWGVPGDVEFKATVTVYRWVQGEKVPFTATARMSEYMPEPPNDFMWRKMPHGQLGKCAEALALRKGFPQELEGLHTFEEMEQANDAPKDTKQPQRRSTTGAPGETRKPATNTLTVVGLVEKVWRPKDKKYFQIHLKDDKRSFTQWIDKGEQLEKDASAFAGTDHQVTLSYVEARKGDKVYYNATGIAIVDEPQQPPQTTKAQEPRPTSPPVTAGDIFGGDTSEPGAEG
jgi:phage recombination protein Bet